MARESSPFPPMVTLTRYYNSRALSSCRTPRTQMGLTSASWTSDRLIPVDPLDALLPTPPPPTCFWNGIPVTAATCNTPKERRREETETKENRPVQCDMAKKGKKENREMRISDEHWP